MQQEPLLHPTKKQTEAIILSSLQRLSLCMIFYVIPPKSHIFSSINRSAVHFEV